MHSGFRICSVGKQNDTCEDLYLTLPTPPSKMFICIPHALTSKAFALKRKNLKGCLQVTVNTFPDQEKKNPSAFNYYIIIQS